MLYVRKLYSGDYSVMQMYFLTGTRVQALLVPEPYPPNVRANAEQLLRRRAHCSHRGRLHYIFDHALSLALDDASGEVLRGGVARMALVALEIATIHRPWLTSAAAVAHYRNSDLPVNHDVLTLIRQEANTGVQPRPATVLEKVAVGLILLVADSFGELDVRRLVAEGEEVIVSNIRCILG